LDTIKHTLDMSGNSCQSLLDGKHDRLEQAGKWKNKEKWQWTLGIKLRYAFDNPRHQTMRKIKYENITRFTLSKLSIILAWWLMVQG